LLVYQQHLQASKMWTLLNKLLFIRSLWQSVNLSQQSSVRTAHMCVCAYHCVQLSYTAQHRTVLIIFPLIGSRPSDHYFRSVCLFVCFCRVFLSRLRSNLDQTRTHVTCPGLVVSLEYRGCATPGGWVTPKNLYF